MVDNGVVVSSVLWSGRPRRIVERLRDEEDVAYQSPAMWGELEDVLRRPRFAARIALTGQTARALLADLRELFVRIEPARPPSRHCRDPNDDMFLSCAEAVGADYLITGDKDLLSLRRIGATRIVTVAQFLDAEDEPERA